MKRKPSPCRHQFAGWSDHIRHYYKFRICPNCRAKEYVIRPGVYKIWRARKVIRRVQSEHVKIIMTNNGLLYKGGHRGNWVGSNLYEFQTSHLIALIDDFGSIFRAIFILSMPNFPPKSYKIPENSFGKNHPQTISQ